MPNRIRRERPLKKKDKIRREYKVPLPDERILFGPVALDLVAKHGNSGKLGLECREELITFWRKNRSRYSEEKINAAERRACDFTKVFRNGTWEHHFQWKEALRRGVDLDAEKLKVKEAKIAKEAQLEAMKALVADLAGVEVRVRPSQIEAMKTVVQDLSINTHVVNNQGNSAVQDKGKSVSDHDHVPDDGDDDEWWAMNAAEVEVIVSQIEARKGKAVVQDDGDDDDDGWGELLIEGDSD